MSIQAEIGAIVTAFVADLTEFVRDAALKNVRAVLGSRRDRDRAAAPGPPVPAPCRRLPLRRAPPLSLPPPRDPRDAFRPWPVVVRRMPQPLAGSTRRAADHFHRGHTR